MESPSSDPKSIQVYGVSDQEAAKLENKKTWSKDSEQEMSSPSSAKAKSSENGCTGSLARSEPVLKAPEDEHTASLMEKREKLKRLINDSDQEISELKKKIHNIGDVERFTDGLSANLSAVEYLKLAIKNKNSEISTLEAVIQNKINMENIMKMKILQIQAKVTKSKAEKASSQGSFLSIGSYSQNFENYSKIEYTSKRQCQCLIF